MKILLQGDSITDAARDKRNYHHMGNGYPKFALAMHIDTDECNAAAAFGEVYGEIV